MIFVNFKTYEAGTGENVYSLVEALEQVSGESGVKIIPVVQAADVKEVAAESILETWVQTIDPVTYGAHTGAILPEAVFEDGAVGVFINHSENKCVSHDNVAQRVARATEVGLKSLVFADNLSEMRDLLQFNPTYIAYEPSELIGRSDVSVATAQPEIIASAFELSKWAGVPLIVGAGVHSREDVRTCLELGAVGVAVARDVMMSADPKQEILDLTEGFK
jgi:triosephosphate isomerase